MGILGGVDTYRLKREFICLFSIQFAQDGGIGEADLIGEGVARAERFAGAHARLKRNEFPVLFGG